VISSKFEISMKSDIYPEFITSTNTILDQLQSDSGMNPLYKTADFIHKKLKIAWNKTLLVFEENNEPVFNLRVLLFTIILQCHLTAR